MDKNSNRHEERWCIHNLFSLEPRPIFCHDSCADSLKIYLEINARGISIHIVINSSFIFRIASPKLSDREREREIGKEKQQKKLVACHQRLKTSNRPIGKEMEWRVVASKKLAPLPPSSPSFPDVDQRYPCPFNSKNIWNCSWMKIPNISIIDVNIMPKIPNFRFVAGNTRYYLRIYIITKISPSCV